MARVMAHQKVGVNKAACTVKYQVHCALNILVVISCTCCVRMKQGVERCVCVPHLGWRAHVGIYCFSVVGDFTKNVERSFRCFVTKLWTVVAESQRLWRMKTLFRHMRATWVPTSLSKCCLSYLTREEPHWEAISGWWEW